MTDFAKLIPELPKWNQGKGIEVSEWIYCMGRFDHAVAYADLFWPAFTIHDGCVMFASFDIDCYNTWMKHTSDDRRAVEAVMNHRHIVDLFSEEESVVGRELVMHLGRTIQDMWSCKLKRDFPDRQITVSFPSDYYEDLTDYEVTFFHDKHKGA